VRDEAHLFESTPGRTVQSTDWWGYTWRPPYNMNRVI
jgi:hypothetical protein